MTDVVYLNVDGEQVKVRPGMRLLDVLREQGVDIPTLCDHEGLVPWGSCRLCMVEVTERGRNRLVASCLYPAERASDVYTESPRVRAARRFVLTLLLARNADVQLVQELAGRYGVSRLERLPAKQEKCTLCLRCVRACAVQGHSAIGTAFRGQEKKVGPPFDEPPADCVGCAACAAVCPTGAIEVIEKGDTRTIWGRTFELVRCKKCGAGFATREQLVWVCKELGQEIEDKLCPCCRQRDEAQRMVKG